MSFPELRQTIILVASSVKKTIKLTLIASLICLAAWYCLGIVRGGVDPLTGISNPSQAGDPYAFMFRVLAIVLIIAAVGHYAAAKLKQSPVLGEIAMGIIVGTLLYQFGGPTMIIIRHYEQVDQISSAALKANVCFSDATHKVLQEAGLPEKDTHQLEQVLLRKDVAQFYLTVNALQLFSSLGVVLLLFMVGLESNVKDMRAVGGWSLGVALIGMAGIFLLGYLALSIFFLKDGNPLIPVFLAAALTATSIGITARVFQDMKRLRLREAKVVLGAAVMDDVLGLIVLAVVTGLASGGGVTLSTVAVIFFKAAGFFVGVLLLGAILVPRLVTLFATLSRGNVKVIFPFAMLMFLAWLADQFGLATIIGAFAAGLIIKEDYFPQGRQGRTVRSIIAPIQAIFAPIFFVLIGLRVDITAFGDLQVLLMSLVLVGIILISKLASALAVKRGDNRLVVAAGMLPRGEVSLIFASLGKTLGLLNDNLFSVIVIVMLLTTFITPPLLKWAIERQELSASVRV
jgi:Kef-type K+ transport system membrane component KefB